MKLEVQNDKQISNQMIAQKESQADRCCSLLYDVPALDPTRHVKMTSPYHVLLVPKTLVKSPVLWSSKDVQQWLEFCVQQFSLNPICPEKFDMNGRAMCLLNRTDFMERVPHVGDVLFNAFQYLLARNNDPHTIHGHVNNSRGSQPSQPPSHFVHILPLPLSEGGLQGPDLSRQEDNPITGISVPSSILSPVSTEKYSSDSDSSPKEAPSPPNSACVESKELLTLDQQQAAADGTRGNALQETGRLLWEFIYQLLKDNSSTDLLSWEDEKSMVFRIKDPLSLAAHWGRHKNRNNMTYEKLSRALRYYYKMKILKKVTGKKLTYKFLQHPSKIRKGQRGARPHYYRQHEQLREIEPVSTTEVTCADADIKPSTLPQREQGSPPPSISSSSCSSTSSSSFLLTSNALVVCTEGRQYGGGPTDMESSPGGKSTFDQKQTSLATFEDLNAGDIKAVETGCDEKTTSATSSRSSSHSSSLDSCRSFTEPINGTLTDRPMENSFPLMPMDTHSSSDTPQTSFTPNLTLTTLGSSRSPPTTTTFVSSSLRSSPSCRHFQHYDHAEMFKIPNIESSSVLPSGATKSLEPPDHRSQQQTINKSPFMPTSAEPRENKCLPSPSGPPSPPPPPPSPPPPVSSYSPTSFNSYPELCQNAPPHPPQESPTLAHYRSFTEPTSQPLQFLRESRSHLPNNNPRRFSPDPSKDRPTYSHPNMFHPYPSNQLHAPSSTSRIPSHLPARACKMDDDELQHHLNDHPLDTFFYDYPQHQTSQPQHNPPSTFYIDNAKTQVDTDSNRNDSNTRLKSSSPCDNMPSFHDLKMRHQDRYDVFHGEMADEENFSLMVQEEPEDLSVKLGKIFHSKSADDQPSSYLTSDSSHERSLQRSNSLT